MTSIPALANGNGSRRSRVGVASKILFGLAVGAIAWWVWQDGWASNERLRRDAEVALARRQYVVAEQLARKLMRRRGQLAAGLFIAGDAAARQERFDDALELLSRIPPRDRSIAMASAYLRGEINLFQRMRLGDAEQCYRTVLSIDPKHIGAHDRMVFVLGLQGRSWEAEPHRVELIRQNRFNAVHLSLLALGETADENPQGVDPYATKAPDDPHVLCRQARDAMRADEIPKARRLLEMTVASEPTMLQAQGWLGTILVREGTGDEFLLWHDRLPPNANDHPEIWFARGTWLQRHHDDAAAAHCFAEAVRLDPNSQAGNHHLAQQLLALGRDTDAEVLLRRSKLLGLLVAAGKRYQVLQSIESMRAAADVCEQLGLRWEAWGWRQLLLALGELRPGDPLVANATAPVFTGQPSADSKFFASLRANLDAGCERRTERRAMPTGQVNLTGLELPNWSKKWDELGKGSPPVTASARPSTDGAVSFRDVAHEVGIDFRYHNANRSGQQLDHMYKFTGGGVGVIDFDVDGCPDLHFTQGCEWPPLPGQREFLDRLFRNLSGERFEDVTEAARIVEDRFSQGVSVGDIDNDGFPDLYVGNIGANRLLRNNGDGTFTDITAESATAGDDWTTSCALADVNGDGLPDIYCVNYLQGEHLFDRPCAWRDGTSRMCTPHEYDAADDVLFLNLGDGRFADVSGEAGLLVPNGKGLGVVAADFDGSGRISLLVANDATPNFFFVGQPFAAGSVPRFDERGFVSGLALDAEGQAQACMGIAAGDADGDGRLDLFVTNFHRESNTLYAQRAGSLFVDATRGTGLREPGFEMLGFGTQFLDGDLDGWSDLVVANGHVARLEAQGIPFEMPPQFFRNVGGGRFVELKADRAGSYFSNKLLGRGLARVDWNRDGREDFAVSHLESPVALVTNETAATGHFLAVSLRGVRSSRDAIGSIVTVRSGTRRWIQHVTAGDGYHASNERRLVFGLGSASRADEVTVRWPSGVTQAYRSLSAGSEWLFIEGRPVEEHQSRVPKTVATIARTWANLRNP
jgi:tetratricopeptide (TPR) repeat protein